MTFETDSEPRNQSDELPQHYRRPRTTIAPAGPLKMLQVERIEEQVKLCDRAVRLSFLRAREFPFLKCFSPARRKEFTV